ncbi:MAG: CDP-alcohol phosphatidyltransferase family protein [candidate division KSB1 bacterium]|nr:CDP-alcohol phosphatidyltransferase family protein [candidate division KSB1 bacterium]MDZ7340929.1 CDP-alcohol phosphatidyltransferase family protein [candidate division KSB1 bacterium]
MDDQKSFAILTIPNLLSFLRILLIVPLAIFVWQDNLLMILVIIVIAMASDFLDGILARRLNQISEVGKILDPLADKLAIGTILLVLYFKNQVPLWLVLVVIGRDVAILFAGLLYARKFKFVMPSNFVGKVTANVLAVMIIAFILKLKFLERIFVPVAICFILLSLYSYGRRFAKLIGNASLTDHTMKNRAMSYDRQ